MIHADVLARRGCVLPCSLPVGDIPPPWSRLGLGTFSMSTFRGPCFSIGSIPVGAALSSRHTSVSTTRTRSLPAILPVQLQPLIDASYLPLKTPALEPFISLMCLERETGVRCSAVQGNAAATGTLDHLHAGK